MTWREILEEMKRTISNQNCRFGGTVFSEETDNNSYCTLRSVRPNQFLLRFGNNVMVEFCSAIRIIKTVIRMDGRFSQYPIENILKEATRTTKTTGFVFESSQEKVEIWVVSKEFMGAKKEMELSDCIMEIQDILLTFANRLGI